MRLAGPRRPRRIGPSRMETSLSLVFLSDLSSDARKIGEDDPMLESKLRAYVEAARAAQAGIAVRDDALVRYLATRSIDGRVAPLEYAGDLLLALACSRGSASAKPTAA